jgi:hypothetical protein
MKVTNKKNRSIGEDFKYGAGSFILASQGFSLKS